MWPKQTAEFYLCGPNKMLSFTRVAHEKTICRVFPMHTTKSKSCGVWFPGKIHPDTSLPMEPGPGRRPLAAHLMLDAGVCLGK